MQWRLLLDPPMSSLTECGFRKAQTCKAFVERASENMIQDPATGLLMLTPSFLVPSLLRQQALSMAAWELVSDFWLEFGRGQGVRETGPTAISPFPFLALRKAATASRPGIALPGTTRAWPIPNASDADRSYWVARSKQLVAEDQGLWVFVEPLSDPMYAPDNYFGVSWDNVLVLIRKRRVVEVYRCDRGSLPGLEQWRLVRSLSLAEHMSPMPEGFGLALIPIPGRGLSVTVTGYKQVINMTGGDTAKVGTASMLVPLPSESTPGGYRMLLQSTVFVRANPYTPVCYSCAFVTYQSSGYFVDGAYALPYPPTVNPSSRSVAGYVAQAGSASYTASVSVMSGDGADPWMPGLQEASSKLSVTTSDARYTPFIHSYEIVWPSVTQTRSPGSVTISDSAIQALEVSDDLDARHTGSCTILTRKGASEFPILTRGDFVYALQNRADAGGDWQHYAIGIGRTADITKLADTTDGQYYQARLDLQGMHERLAETHVMNEGGFDGLPLSRAINNVLTAAAFAPIPEASYPLAMRTTTIPSPQGNERFKYAPTLGQTGLDVLDTLLRFVEGQNVRYRMRFGSAGWVAERVPVGTTPVILSMASAGAPGAWTSDVAYQSLPPEANVIIAVGATEAEGGGERIVASYVNENSITQPSHPDYLGRQRVAMLVIPEVTSSAELSRYLRQLELRIAHRLVRVKVECPAGWTDSLWYAPGTAVRLQDAETEEPIPVLLYVIRRTVSYDGYRSSARLTYLLSSDWRDVEGER